MTRALLVVDMIEDFVRESGALYCGPSMTRILPVVKREITRSRAAGEPVVYLADNHLPTDAEFAMLPPHAIAGTKGREIVRELAPLEGRRQPAVEHRPRDGEELLPRERREKRPRDERGPRGDVRRDLGEGHGERDEVDDRRRIQHGERQEDEVHRPADLAILHPSRPEHAADRDGGEHDGGRDTGRRKEWL